MCGINGIISNQFSSLLRDSIELMNNALAHRGPDDAGVFMYKNMALGHRRLSIIDLSTDGHQPMQYEEGRFTIVYNGELYNYLELREELRNLPQAISFKTQSDTEVILAAYAAWGDKCLEKFSGMYAFAIFDKKNNSLFLGRDRMGIKPLYYYHKDGVFAFSSEIRPLLKSGLVPRKLDANNLVDYLRYQTVHAPNTIIKDVYMLMPGHFASLDINSLKLEMKCYWDIVSKARPLNNETQANNAESYKEACSQVNTLFTNAVKSRLIADVPFGAFLSGGIDSSAVVGMMSKLSSGKVKTFSVTFYEKEYNEEKYSRLVADKFNTDHHAIKLSAADFRDKLPSALKAMDHPGGDGPNTYVVSKLTKEAGITMALSGLGGDELFAGYDIFKRSVALMENPWLNQTPIILRRLAAWALKNMKSSVSNDKIAEVLAQPEIALENFYPISRQVLLDRQISELLNLTDLPENEVSIQARKIMSQMPPENYILSSVSLMEMTTYMQNVLLRDTDQMAMASALEVRVPFLDYELVEYVLSLNDTIKYPHTPKKLFVDAMGDLLPEEIVNRQKMGFSFPWGRWLKTDLKQFCEERIYSLAKRNLFNERGLIKLWKRFLVDDKRVTWSRIWYLVVLENWLIENNIES